MAGILANGRSSSRVTGLSDARAILKHLPDRMQRTVMRSAVRGGAVLLRKEIRAAAPVGDAPTEASVKYGTLKSNIRVIRLKRDVPKGSALYRVDTGNAFWGYFIEFGTGKYYTGAGSRSKGSAAITHIPAKPWFRPVVDANFDRSVNQIKERIAAGVERQALKLAKK